MKPQNETPLPGGTGKGAKRSRVPNKIHCTPTSSEIQPCPHGSEILLYLGGSCALCEGEQQVTPDPNEFERSRLKPIRSIPHISEGIPGALILLLGGALQEAA